MYNIDAGPQFSVRTYRRGDEAAIVELLNSAFTPVWGTIATWHTKHLDRPGFSPDDVFIVESTDRIVGCLHCVIVFLQIAPTETLQAAIDCDLAVARHMQGFGVAELLYAISASLLEARGVVLRMGWSDCLRAKFYTRVLGYVSGMENPAAYVKTLDITTARRRLEQALDTEASEPPQGLLVELVIVGLPSLFFRLIGNRIVVAMPNTAPDVRLEADQRLLSTVSNGSFDKMGVLLLILRRSIRVKAPVRAVVRALLWLVRYWLAHVGRNLSAGRGLSVPFSPC